MSGRPAETGLPVRHEHAFRLSAGLINLTGFDQRTIVWASFHGRILLHRQKAAH